MVGREVPPNHDPVTCNVPYPYARDKTVHLIHFVYHIPPFLINIILLIQGHGWEGWGKVSFPYAREKAAHFIHFVKQGHGWERVI